MSDENKPQDPDNRPPLDAETKAQAIIDLEDLLRRVRADEASGYATIMFGVGPNSDHVIPSAAMTSCMMAKSIAVLVPNIMNCNCGRGMECPVNVAGFTLASLATRYAMTGDIGVVRVSQADAVEMGLTSDEPPGKPN